MFRGSARELAAAVVASTVVLSGSWVFAAHAAPDNAACVDAIDLAEQMTEVNGQFIGTMGARSVSLRLGDDAKVESLTPKLEGLRAEYQSLHTQMRTAAARC